MTDPCPGPLPPSLPRPAAALPAPAQGAARRARRMNTEGSSSHSR